MAKAKIRKLPLISSQITSSVSVALVLLLLGMVAMLGLAARNITRLVKEDVGFTVVLSEGASPGQIEQLAADLDGMTAVREARFVSADTVLARWQEMQGPDAENVMDLLGVNPFTAEFDVSVTEDYASTDSILSLTEGMLDNPAVVEISMSNEMIDSLNSTVKSLSLVMVIVALALLVISFILINNTVRLTIYARRFLIHTMKLVGATDRYIRRPLVVSSLLSGLAASIFAVILLALLIYYAGHLDPVITEAVDPLQTMIVFGGMIVAGLTICVVSAAMSAHKYIRMNRDEIYSH